MFACCFLSTLEVPPSPVRTGSVTPSNNTTEGLKEIIIIKKSSCEVHNKARKLVMLNSGLYLIKLTAKIILLLRAAPTQQSTKSDKSSQVCALLKDKTDGFWQGERPGRGLCFVIFQHGFITRALKFCCSEISMYGNRD